MSLSTPSERPGLPVSRACDLRERSATSSWLVEGLWGEQAVGILGGEPKCCKSFLALDMAVAVASGRPCLRRFPVRRTGPVLLFPAEDAPEVVRQRLEGICEAADTRLRDLPIYVITAPRLLLDLPQDRDSLRATVEAVQPVLLVLDPFIRLHRADENASNQVAPLLGYLRELQRELQVAVLLVHHVRKRSGKDRPGQALRGSSDLHGWGDSNLYLRRKATQLVLSIEHRAAAAEADVSLHLHSDGPALALRPQPATAAPAPETPPASPADRVLSALRSSRVAIPTQQLRKLCALRTTTLCQTLLSLRQAGHVVHATDGYRLAADTATRAPHASVSFPAHPIGSAGNGNGKQRPGAHNAVGQLVLFSGET